MEDKWNLFILFIVLFNFADIFTTEINLKQRETHPERVISDKCRVILPPECDSNPIIRETGSAVHSNIVFSKIISSIIVLLFVIFWKNPMLIYTLISLNAGLIWVVLSNLSISFWRIAFLFNIISILFIIILIKKFTVLKEEKWYPIKTLYPILHFNRRKSRKEKESPCL